MTDDATMRFRLQQVASYRQVRAAVRAGASHTLINALIWLGITALLYEAIGPSPVVFIQFAIGLGELGVGVWKKFYPTVEAVLVDGLILVAFGGFVLGRQIIAWQGIINWPVSPISVFLGLWLLHGALNSFRGYAALRRAFPDRPSADQIAWFDDLVREIRASTPVTEADAIDLPTKPKLKAKLLGTTAFFVGTKDDTVFVAGPFDFELARERTDPGTGRRKARLRVYDQEYPEFALDDAGWANYQRWAGANLPPQQATR